MLFLFIYGEILKRSSFSKKERLVSNEQFRAVLARKLRARNGLLTLYMAENDCGYPRLGVSVGKSCGGAVVRNRLKRLLREAFRQNRDRLPAGFDYLLMISPDFAKLNGSKGVGDQLRKLTFEKAETSFLALVEALVEKISR